MTPISLLTCMTATRSDALVELARRAASRSSRPSGSTGRTVRSMPCPASHSQVSSTAACSVATRDDPVAALRRLLDRSLERPVERLGRAAGEGDAAALQADRLLDLLARDLDRRLGLTAPARRRVRIGEFLLDPRLHRLRRLRARPASSPGNRGRSCGLRLGTAGDLAPLAEEAVDVGLARRRAEADADDSRRQSRPGRPSPRARRLGFMLPDEQALPAETEMPARSSWTSWLGARHAGHRVGADRRDPRRSAAMTIPPDGMISVLQSLPRVAASRGIASAKARAASAAAIAAAPGKFSVPRR